jgi:hypothetical protein
MLNYLDGMLFAAKKKLMDFMNNEEGDVNIVSIVVLIGIAVALAVIFRKQIVNLLNNLFSVINQNATDAVKPE